MPQKQQKTESGLTSFFKMRIIFTATEHDCVRFARKHDVTPKARSVYSVSFTAPKPLKKWWVLNHVFGALCFSAITTHAPTTSIETPSLPHTYISALSLFLSLPPSLPLSLPHSLPHSLPPHLLLHSLSHSLIRTVFFSVFLSPSLSLLASMTQTSTHWENKSGAMTCLRWWRQGPLICTGHAHRSPHSAAPILHSNRT